jgi:magnesium-protoporphyrin O-methyltransferase
VAIIGTAGQADAAALKRRLLDYFDGTGFERWRAIYGDARLSGVRATIRAGHDEMLATAVGWLAEGLAPGAMPHVLDAGCGTGLLATALAARGARVTAVDLAPQMDVLVHYPADDLARMVGRLARLTRGPLVLTYAPREPLLAALHWVGGRFPSAQRRTDIQLVSERHVARALAAAGMRVRRQTRVSRGFYHIALVEAGCL